MKKMNWIKRLLREEKNKRWADIIGLICILWVIYMSLRSCGSAE